MTPTQVKHTRNWFMLATEKEKNRMVDWLNERDVEFIHTLGEAPHQYMSVDQLKQIFIQWEAYYWKGLRKWMFFFGAVGLAFVVQVARSF